MNVSLSTVAPTTAPSKASVPLEKLRYPSGHGIPNWTTSDPHPAGTLQTAPRGLPATPFVVSDANVGPRNIYASADAAVQAMRRHASEQAIAIIHNVADGSYSGHAVWTYTQQEGTENTRLAGSTITTFSPLRSGSIGGFGGFTTPYEGLAAIVAGTHLLKPVR